MLQQMLERDGLAADVYSNLLMYMAYVADLSAARLNQTAGRFGSQLAAPLLRTRPFTNTMDASRRLRVGFVSADFSNHAVNYFFEPLLRRIDRTQFEVFAYSNTQPEDDVTARLKSSFDHWRCIVGVSDDDAADLIEADAIDILVDLSGHTAGNRLLVFARKPAPVQVTWLGFPATTGMSAMDWRITDAIADPPGLTEQYFSEKLYRLPGMFCCYQAPQGDYPVIDHLPADDNGHITFGCFNNFAKVTDEALSLWARILHEVPNSKLLLEIKGIDSPQFKLDTLQRLERLGLPLNRLLLVPRVKANQFVLYNRVDIVLDPFPYNGGTTSIDALWMGVPFIALEGGHFSARLGTTILRNAGLHQLVASSPERYVQLAADLARNPQALRALRLNLRQRVEQSPVMDADGFAGNMQEALRQMWRQFCAQPSQERVFR